MIYALKSSRYDQSYMAIGSGHIYTVKYICYGIIRLFEHNLILLEVGSTAVLFCIRIDCTFQNFVILQFFFNF